jgi:hypothetical protein
MGYEPPKWAVGLTSGFGAATEMDVPEMDPKRTANQVPKIPPMRSLSNSATHQGVPRPHL